MVRNFPDHLMYVSFPKFSNSSADENYNKRFLKKIMFYGTRSESSLLFDPDESELLTFQRDELLDNPEHYHQSIDAMYGTGKEEGPGDLNRNVFVFPVRMANLRSEKEPAEPYRDIEPYESHFIRFMLRDHLFSEMHRFRPTQIVVSYSGRLNIENDHWLELIQELSKICNRVLFFPNFTIALVR
jgi:hypothetical protein